MPGPQILPFRGLRFTAAAGPPSTLICPPYDVINPGEQTALVARNPHNIVRLELPETRPTDDLTVNRYTRATDTLVSWRAAGLLAPSREPAIYVFEQVFSWLGERHRRVSFLARVRLELPEAGLVKPHERTQARARADRLQLLRHVRAQVSPVWSMYAATEPLGVPEAAPDLEARSDGEALRVWEVSEPGAIDRVIGTVGDAIYIADGHHRYQTALDYRDELRDRAQSWSGEELENFVMMALSPADDLLVLPWHRLVRATPPADFDRRLREHFIVADVDAAADVSSRLTGRPASFGMLAKGSTRLLTVRDSKLTALSMPRERSPAWRELAVAILQEMVLRGCLGLDEQQVAANVTYTIDPSEAQQAVDDGRAELAFLLPATTTGDVLAVSDAQDTMPPKSTCFHPKIPTGMALYSLDPPTA